MAKINHSRSQNSSSGGALYSCPKSDDFFQITPLLHVVCSALNVSTTLLTPLLCHLRGSTSPNSARPYKIVSIFSVALGVHLHLQLSWNTELENNVFGLSDNEFYSPSLTCIAVVAESTCVFYSSMTVATESHHHCVRETIIPESAGAAITSTNQHRLLLYMLYSSSASSDTAIIHRRPPLEDLICCAVYTIYSTLVSEQEGHQPGL